MHTKTTNQSNKSSNLIFLSALLGFVNLLLSPDIRSNDSLLLISVISLAIVIVIGVLVRIGVQWIKYFMLVSIILALFNLPFIKQDFQLSPINGTISLIVSAFQVWALILLFKRNQQ
ncbi:hypothetical protein DEU42_103146 [Flavobacterium sp. AG291]|nr:hypothetical protein DEU42_103146 [Flavobacterium sp. AG291]